MAATSRNWAGKLTLNFIRDTRTTPSSSGWRRVSSTLAGNSPSSSRNRTPWWAREISPGRMVEVPPPTRDTLEALWWGARNGGAHTSVPPRGGAPAPRGERGGPGASPVGGGGGRPGG